MFDADQQVVVNHGDGPMLVIAGAGSGKTTAVVGRAARLITEGLDPLRHLMLTFTRKAAEEMRHRIAAKAPGIELEALQVYTFHSFCWKVLRRNPGLFGCMPGVTLLMEDDITRIFTHLAKTLGLINSCDPTERKEQARRVHAFQSLYSMLRNEGGELANDQAVWRVLAREMPGAEAEAAPHFRLLCDAYEEHKARTNTLDFDDLLTVVVRGLLGTPALLEKLQREYPRLTVDESQDTNLPQFKLVELLAGTARNVVMVGDDDQAIYAWRGARPQNLRDFETQFGAKVAYLMNNYRSQQRIVAAAGEHISYNLARFDKAPKPMRPAQEKLVVWHHDSGTDAARALAKLVQDEIKRGTPAANIAVLFRTNRAVHVLKRAFAAQRIPHHVVNGLDFVTQGEVQLTLALGRLACNPRDASALQRICEVLDGVGAKAVELVVTTSQALEIPVLDAIAHTKLSARAAASLNALKQVVDALRTAGPLALVDTVYTLGVIPHYRAKDKDADITSRRVAALAELKEMIIAWLEGLGLPVEEQWQVIFDALLLDTKHNDLPDGRVWLSTVHQAKGLEWAQVHVWGLSDGIFPMFKGDEEEERRLSYVAITRAKDQCHLWHANEYPDRHGMRFARSRFIRELPKAHLEVKEREYA